MISTSYIVAAPLNNGDSYQWYVTAFDNYGNIGLAPPPLSFTVSLPTPPPPIVTGPIGKIASPSPTFAVTSVAGASRYTLYLRDTTTGQYPLGTTAWQINGGSYTLPFPPFAGDNYEWYISAYDAFGNLLYQSPTATYVLSTATDLAAPPKPSSLVGPITTTPTLQWSPVANAVGYEVELTDTTAGVDHQFPPSPMPSTSPPTSPARPCRLATRTTGRSRHSTSRGSLHSGAMASRSTSRRQLPSSSRRAGQRIPRSRTSSGRLPPAP